MAERPVFITKNEPPYYKVVKVSFDWSSGFAKVQKQKNITAIHQAFLQKMPERKVLEISSKSLQEYGESLSAFFLKKFVPELGYSIPVECIFQSSKTFRHGGPYKDLMLVSPRDAKRDDRLKNSGQLTGFTFEGKLYPLNPKTIFYDFIYINALYENQELLNAILEYDAFTDIEFNPSKSVNCQAKAAAIFVSLHRNKKTDSINDFESFVKLFE